MSMEPRLDWDPSTTSYIGPMTLPGVQGLATKADLYIFGGLHSRWRVCAGYHLTPEEIHKETEARFIISLFKEAKRLKLRVRANVCDVRNRGVLTELGYCTQRDDAPAVAAQPSYPLKLLTTARPCPSLLPSCSSSRSTRTRVPCRPCSPPSRITLAARSNSAPRQCDPLFSE